MSSSSHSTKAATAISSAIRSSTKLAMVGIGRRRHQPFGHAGEQRRHVGPVPPATASLMASVADRLRITIWIATTASNSASGSCTR